MFVPIARFGAALALTLACATVMTRARAGTQTIQPAGSYTSDFDVYRQTVHEHFAYFGAERRSRDWDAVRTIYRPLTLGMHDDASFVRLLEHTNNELYNGHVTLNTNLRDSNRIIPTGADLWARRERGEREDFFPPHVISGRVDDVAYARRLIVGPMP